MISKLSGVYNRLKRWMDPSAMGTGSISCLTTRYNWVPTSSICFILGVGLLLHLLHIGVDGSLYPPLLAFGFLRRDDMKKKRWALISRVSTGSQLGNTSTGIQLDHLEHEVDEADGSVVKKYEDAESGSTTDRESLNEIRNMAENDDLDVVGVWKLDRLTRADPWESFSYLQDLRDAEVTLYSGGYGYFDFEDPRDVKQVIGQVAFAREGYNRINENSEKGQIKQLENKKWPFFGSPVGYVVDENNNIELASYAEVVIPEIYQLYLKTENRAETQRRINDSDILKGEELSDGNIKTILRSKLCIGHLALKGETIQTDRQLKVVDNDVYWRAQEVLNERKPSQVTTSDFSEEIGQLIAHYGSEFALSQIDTLTVQCPKCEGQLESYGSTTRLGKKEKNYKCEKCNWQGPLMSSNNYEKIHGTHLLRCPFCTSTEAFEVDNLSDKSHEYEYTCTACGNSFGTDQPPDRYKRAIRNPNLTSDISNQKRADDPANLSDSSKEADAQTENEETGKGSDDKYEPWRRSAMELFEENFSIQRVSGILGIGSDTVSGWKRAYDENEKVAKRKSQTGGGPRKVSQDLLPELEECLSEGPQAYGFSSNSWSLRRVGTLIEKEFGVSVHKSTVWRYLQEIEWEID